MRPGSRIRRPARNHGRLADARLDVRQPRGAWQANPRCARRPAFASAGDGTGPDHRVRRHERRNQARYTLFRTRPCRPRRPSRPIGADRGDRRDDNLSRPGAILPVGRLLASRVVRINDAIRAAAQRPSVRLVDLYGAPSMTESDTWSDDRVHGSARATRCSPLPPPRRWACLVATTIGPGPTTPSGRHFDRGCTRRHSGPRTCSCRGFGGTPGADRVGTAGAPTVRSWNAWASYKPKKGSGIGDWPLPIDDTIAGQNMEIAMPVNIVAGPSDMPPTSATFAAASAAV